MDIFVGRQPILNRHGNIYGYELLHRNSERNVFSNIDPEKATIEVLVHTFLTIGIDQVAGRRLSFINFPESLLAQNVFTQLDPEKVVIEVLEDVNITPAMINRLKAFKKAGFKIALDDFVFHDQFRKYPELFKLVNIIKVDFANTSHIDRVRIEALAKDYPHIHLLAEKVETEAEFQDAQERGYQLFQGYFFAKPEILRSKEIPSNVALHFHVIQKLNSPNPDVDKIASLVEHDVSLSYKFLRYINSLAFEVPNEVHSIRQAIMLMGINEAKKWMHVLMLHDLGEGNGNGRTRALVDYSLSRAKMCELLAKRNRKKDADTYFLAGMFSLIDAIMKRPLEDVLPLLPLSDCIVRTLHGEQTRISDYLRLAIAVERLDLDQIGLLSKRIGITESELGLLTREVQRWVSYFD